MVPKVSLGEAKRKDRAKFRKSVCLFVFSFIAVSMTSGVAFGWPALRRHLIFEEGKTEWNERMLGIIFICGGWSTQGSRLFFGLLLDHTCLGTKGTTCLAIFLCLLGAGGLAVAETVTGMSISMLFLGFGAGVQLMLQGVAKLFPKYQGLIISSLSGAFQVASLVFLLLLSLFNDRRLGFCAFSATLFALFVVGATVLPRKYFEEDRFNSNEMLVEDSTESKAEVWDGVETVAKERTSLWSQMKHMEYILLLTWFSIQLAPLQYYLATIGYQLEQRGDDDGKYTRLFLLIFASSSVVAPLVGYTSDSLGLGIAQGFSTFLVAMSFALLSIRSIALPYHVIGLVCYGVGRLAVFSMFFTNVGVRFGYGNFGTLSGIGLLLSSLVSLLQYPMIDFATDDTKSSGPAADSIVDVICGVTVFAMLPYCAWLSAREKSELIEGTGSQH